MSKNTMEPTQRTNESVDEAAEVPKVGEFIRLALVLCMLALLIASCVQLEDAEMLLQAASR